MPTLQEGGLRFDFPDDESDVVRYDGSSFYRQQFQRVCGGAKAVDFIVVEQERTWLIEVKDYRRSPRTKTVDISDEVAAKVRDTLAGLAACRCNSGDAEERGLRIGPCPRRASASSCIWNRVPLARYCFRGWQILQVCNRS